jgi:hypothetical protein
MRSVISLLSQAERGVQRGHHPVELGQQLVVVVERAVGKHVDLGPGEQTQPVEAGVDLAHALGVAAQLTGGYVVAEAVRGRVVRDRQVLVAALERGTGHLLDGVASVGGSGVAVQVAADVLEANQPGQRTFPSGAQLATVLAQLRLDVLHPEHAVDLLLGRALVGDGGGVVGHPVLGDVKAASNRVGP